MGKQNNKTMTRLSSLLFVLLVLSKHGSGKEVDESIRHTSTFVKNSEVLMPGTKKQRKLSNQVFSSSQSTNENNWASTSNRSYMGFGGGQSTGSRDSTTSQRQQGGGFVSWSTRTQEDSGSQRVQTNFGSPRGQSSLINAQGSSNVGSTRGRTNYGSMGQQSVVNNRSGQNRVRNYGSMGQQSVVNNSSGQSRVRNSWTQGQFGNEGVTGSDYSDDYYYYYYNRPSNVAIAKTTFNSNGEPLVTSVLGPWQTKPQIPGYRPIDPPSSLPIAQPQSSMLPTATPVPTPSLTSPVVPPSASQLHGSQPFYSPVVPTVPSFNFSIFTPPKTVVQLTSAPTVSPTSEPTKAPAQTEIIETDPIAYEAVGKADLSAIEKNFFEQTERLLTPYLAKHVGFVLRNYKLTITFVEDTDGSQREVQGDLNFYLNIFEIKLRLELYGIPPQLKPFDKEKMQDLVAKFLTGDNLVELINWMNTKDIPIKMIRLYDPNNPSPIPTEGQHDEGNSGGVSNPILLASLLCFSLVLLSVAAVFYVKRRTTRLHGSGKMLESPMNSVYSNGSEDGSVAVGARATTSPKIRTEHQEKDLEHAYEDHFLDPSTEQLLPTPYRLQNSASQNNTERVTEETTPEDDERNLYFHDALHEEDGRATLESLDGQGSLNRLSQTYPEFDMFVNVAPAGTEALPNQGRSGNNDFHHEDNRIRYQEVNDSTPVGLPDHESFGMDSENDGEKEMPSLL